MNLTCILTVIFGLGLNHAMADMALSDYEGADEREAMLETQAVRARGLTRAPRNHSTSGARCRLGRMVASDMPESYNDRSVGFFVDMGLVLTNWYGLSENISDFKLKRHVNAFVEPARSFANAQKKATDQELYDSVVGLLNILITHTVNDTSISYSDYKNYGIKRSVFSPFRIREIVRHRSDILKKAVQNDNDRSIAVRKDVAVRIMQLKAFHIKGPKNMTSIIHDDVDWSDYKTRYRQYVENICMVTKDVETVRQVRNHFAYWLATGSEDVESEAALTATYSSTGDPNSFGLPIGVHLSIASAVVTMAGAILIGLFLSA